MTALKKAQRDLGTNYDLPSIAIRQKRLEDLTLELGEIFESALREPDE